MTTDISDISEKMEDENSEQFMMDFFNMAGFGGTDFAEMSERMGKKAFEDFISSANALLYEHEEKRSTGNWKGTENSLKPSQDFFVSNFAHVMFNMPSDNLTNNTFLLSIYFLFNE